MLAVTGPEENIFRGYIKPDPHIISGPFSLGELSITPLPVVHAKADTIGFLFRAPGAPSIAYIPDVKSIPDKTMALLRGADILIIDALRTAPHPTHLSTDEALEVIARAEAGRAWLTHLSHESEHHELEAILPHNVRAAYDGLRIRS